MSNVEFVDMTEEDAESPNYSTALPIEFQVINESRVPLLQTGESSSSQDFLILAEFSELEGPIPLCTYPPWIKWNKLCLNNFSVHLMSTDYQVNAMGQFKITEDTQVLRKNVFKNVHVFMEYFTLYDIKARGFVRPFCFGYVSKDHVKLDAKMEILIKEFDTMTKILKQSNRRWFAGELDQYLSKLREAKESYFERRSRQGEGSSEGGVFSFEEDPDPDAISLEQIAHQFSEIENISRIVKSHDNPSMIKEIEDFSILLRRHSYSPFASFLLDKLALSINPNLEQTSIDSLNIPLVHPLKSKGESLRPLTTLGQLGTVHLIWKFMRLHKEHKKDLLFSKMAEITRDFEQHCRDLKGGGGGEEEGVSSFSYVAKDLDEEIIAFIENPEAMVLLEKIHTCCPLPPCYDNRSASYHTVSEQDSSDLNQNGSKDDEGSGVVGVDSAKSSPSHISSGQIQSTSTATTLPPSLSSTGSSQPEEAPTGLPPPAPPSPGLPCNPSSETIIPRPWCSYIESSLPRGSPGYGILKFFRHYPKFAHHLLYSILIGRCLIIAGTEEQRSKVSRILTALIPFVPTAREEWKLLRFHRGVLVRPHIKEFKLIGLCVPERLIIHDLIAPHDQSCATVFNIALKKCVLLGPAYAGGLFSSFEGRQANLFPPNSDIAFISYIGTILVELETKVFMYKVLRREDKRVRGAELGIKQSDFDIVRYLSSLIKEPEQVLGIFG